MLNDIKDFLKNTVFSRLFIIILVIFVLFFILIRRLFVLQIINGEEYLNNFTLRIKKEITLDSARGNIYDRNGNLLAYNELAYSVTIEDNYENNSLKNQNINNTILNTVKIIEKCGDGDCLINNFNVVINDSGQYEYTVSDSRLLRFLADVYGHPKTDDLKRNERNATPDELIEYLCSSSKYGIGNYTYENDERKFIPMDGYTKEEILQIITVRYSMSTNSYQKYLSTEIASDINDITVAAIMENKDNLQGVDIEENLLRRYNQAEYMAHILGYVGNASTDDLVELAASDHEYTINDTVGKAGIEKALEEKLQGNKGKDVVYTDNVGKVLETAEHIDPVAGDNVYLSIDSDLQRAVYNMLEQKLAGILVSKIVNMKEYNNSVVKSSRMMIPIDDVYYALINNNVIDFRKFSNSNAHTFEKEVYNAFCIRQNEIIRELKTELLETGTPYNQLTTEFEVYESYIISMLSSSNRGVIISEAVDKHDPTYIAWAKDETISLKEYLNYALAQNWIDISKFEINSKYSDADEVYKQLVEYICEELVSDSGFAKKMYKYLIKDNYITGQQLCMILFEQNIVYGTGKEKNAVESGEKSAYDFIINKIANIEITPAQLALDPCSGSCVVLSNRGEVLALVSYPGYDVNRLTNTIDSEYYSSLMLDASSPVYNYATQQMTAPGSTFKMISAVTGLEENIIDVDETLGCLGKYVKENLDIEKTCWVYPSGHSYLNVTHAIEHSCNNFFYEVGYRLATNSGESAYNEELGLDRIHKYADMFGLTEKTGIEMEESEPQFSDTLPIDSAIGQGSHNYTTIGIARYVNTIANRGYCYNLTLIDKLVSSDGTVVESYAPSVRNKVVLHDSTWDAVQEGMRLVAATNSSFRDINMKIAGKTGTAQTSKSRTNHALFVGYAPYENPEITIAVRIAYGYTSANAASFAGDVFKYYFKLEDTDKLINGIADTELVQDIDD